MEEFFDEERTEDDLWFKDFVPDVRNSEKGGQSPILTRTLVPFT